MAQPLSAATPLLLQVRFHTLWRSQPHAAQSAAATPTQQRTGDQRLHEEAKHGDERQAAVFDLLHLQLGQGVGVVAQAQGAATMQGSRVGW